MKAKLITQIEQFHQLSNFSFKQLFRPKYKKNTLLSLFNRNNLLEKLNISVLDWFID